MVVAVSFPGPFDLIWGCCAVPVIGVPAVAVLLTIAATPRTTPCGAGLRLSRAIAVLSALLTLTILALWIFAPRYWMRDVEAGGFGWRIVWGGDRIEVIKVPITALPGNGTGIA